MITDQEARTYLGAMCPRGDGMVRGSDVSNVKAYLDGLDLVVTMSHSQHGAFEVRFVEIGPEFIYPSWKEHDEGVTNDDAREIVESGTWEINVDKRQLYAGRQSFLGYSSTRINFADIILTLPESVPTDGRCRACGSEEFILRSFGTQRLKVVGPHNFESTAPASLKILNAIPHIQCASCNTEHSSSGTFNGGFIVDGRSNRREDQVKT